MNLQRNGLLLDLGILDSSVASKTGRETAAILILIKIDGGHLIIK